MDRRVLFFVGAAAACVLLVPVGPSEFHWVCWALAVVYLVLAAAAALDGWTRRRSVPERAVPEPDEARSESVRDGA